MGKPHLSTSGPRRTKFSVGNVAERCMASIQRVEEPTGASMEIEEAYSKQPLQTAAEAVSLRQNAARPVSGMRRRERNAKLPEFAELGSTLKTHRCE